jgi:hypothetical protein
MAASDVCYETRRTEPFSFEGSRGLFGLWSCIFWFGCGRISSRDRRTREADLGCPVGAQMSSKGCNWVI